MTPSPWRKITDAVRRRTRSGVLAFALVAAALFSSAHSAHAILKTDEPAIDILGQFDSATMADNPADYNKKCVFDGASPFGFDEPQSAAIDATNHWLFVSEYDNNRVLVFPLTSGNLLSSKTPSYVLGQTDFAGCSDNQGGTTGQNTLFEPLGVAVDPTNQLLYVSDSGNQRVLVFSTASISNGMNASYELGQAAGGTAFTAADDAGGQSGFGSPQYLALDTAHHLLYVSDEGDNRVMVFSVSTITNGENATYVLGQSSFTTSTAATTQGGMSAPEGLAYDATNQRLFVSDCTNNRVLVFSVSTITNGMNASFELGQASGSNAFKTATANTTQAGLSGPQGLAYDSANTRLFVGDAATGTGTSTNNRVMVFNVATGTIANGENASYVLGQSGFTTATAATTQSGFDDPVGLAYDSTNLYLYVTDNYNDRVMIFNVATGTIANGENAADLLGQYNSATSTATVVYTQSDPNNGPNDLGFAWPSDVAIDAVNHYLFVADPVINRVLVYALSADNSLSASNGGHTASYVLGQPGLQGYSAVATTQSGMSWPQTLAVDSANKRLFVVDTSNNRVLVFSYGSGFTNGMNASYVLGQPDFVSGGNGGATQSSLNLPLGVAYDSANTRLFVVDGNNNRVMVFNVATGTIANGENAINELGHASGGTAYSTAASGTTAIKMNFPDGVAYDAANTRLFVADQTNNRVMVFSVPPGFTNGPTATNIIGQTSATAGGTGLSQTTMNEPEILSYDPDTQRLFLADNMNVRVLVYNAGPSVLPAFAAPAAYVIGQTGFTNNTLGTSQSTLQLDSANEALSCAKYDPAAKRLFVCDTNNYRVMIFDGSYLGNSFFIPGYD
jgi:DNA-binding beta-propeller fold protein YncE